MTPTFPELSVPSPLVQIGTEDGYTVYSIRSPDGWRKGFDTADAAKTDAVADISRHWPGQAVRVRLVESAWTKGEGKAAKTTKRYSVDFRVPLSQPL